MPSPRRNRLLFRARNTTFSPAQLTGLTAWYESDTLALADGVAVASWPDSGPNGYTMTQASGGLQPLFQAAALNGRGTISFDGIDDFLRNTSVPITQPVTIYFIGRFKNSDPGAFSVAVSGGSANIYQSSGTNPTINLYGGSVVSGQALGQNEWQLFTIIFNGASSKIYRDGNLEATLNSGTTNGTGGLQLGGVVSFFGNVEIAAYLICAANANASDRANAESYLRSKWLTPTGTSFVLQPSDLADNAYSTNLGEYYRSSPFARAVFTTSARFVRVRVHANMFGSGATFAAQQAEIGIRSNGTHIAATNITVDGYMYLYAGLPSGTNKTVEVVCGGQELISGTLYRTFLVDVAFDGSATLTAPSTPASRVAVYGDSITCGKGATVPVKESWAQLLRANIAVALEAWGFRSLFDDSGSTARAVLVTQLASFAPSKVLLTIGTNDYGLNKWSAASFGAEYALLLDDLHTALPSATIYAQTPIVRSTETANGSGSTLGDYRTQISTAQSTRSAWCTLVDGTTFMTTASLVDGIHPSTAGHSSYYSAIKTALGV